MMLFRLFYSLLLVDHGLVVTLILFLLSFLGDLLRARLLGKLAPLPKKVDRSIRFFHLTFIALFFWQLLLCFAYCWHRVLTPLLLQQLLLLQSGLLGLLHEGVHLGLGDDPLSSEALCLLLSQPSF